MAVKVNLEMTVRQYKKLADYLARHESDIADELNDFGDLHELYVTVFEQTPE